MAIDMTAMQREDPVSNVLKWVLLAVAGLRPLLPPLVVRLVPGLRPASRIVGDLP